MKLFQMVVGTTDFRDYRFYIHMCVFDFLLPWILYNNMHMEKNGAKLHQVRQIATQFGCLQMTRWMENHIFYEARGEGPGSKA